MALDLEEQEQLAELKAWWKQHGNLIVLAIVAAAVAFSAWQGWRWYQASQAAQGAAVYE
jgi:predicted negative regulator of RcsB-dependent stress response